MLASNTKLDHVDGHGSGDTVDGPSQMKEIIIPAEADYLIANSTVPGKLL